MTFPPAKHRLFGSRGDACRSLLVRWCLLRVQREPHYPEFSAGSHCCVNHKLYSYTSGLFSSDLWICPTFYFTIYTLMILLFVCFADCDSVQLPGLCDGRLPDQLHCTSTPLNTYTFTTKHIQVHMIEINVSFWANDVIDLRIMWTDVSVFVFSQLKTLYKQIKFTCKYWNNVRMNVCRWGLTSPALTETLARPTLSTTWVQTGWTSTCLLCGLWVRWSRTTTR